MNAPAIALVVVGSFAVGASWLRLSRVVSALPLEIEPLTAIARRGGGREAALASALEEALPASAIAELARGLAEAEVRIRTSQCNEALHDINVEIEWGSAIPAAMLRLCLFAAGLAMVASVAMHLPVGEQILEIVGVAGGALILVSMSRREADRIAKKARGDIDAWVTASTRARAAGGIVASR